MTDGTGGYQGVLVLGGTSEIAAATLRAMNLRPGARVLLTGRDPVRLAASGQSLRADRPGVEVNTAHYDARGTAPAAAELVSDAARWLGEVDLVLCAVGLLPDQRRDGLVVGPALDALAVNLVGPVTALLLLAEHLQSQGHGDLVVLSSIAAVRPRGDSVVYATGKAGLDAFAVGLGDALAGTGVHVLVVRSGFVVGRMTAGWRPAPLATTPSAVAAATVEALRRRRSVVWVPPPLRLLAVAIRAAPMPLWRRAASRVAQPPLKGAG